MTRLIIGTDDAAIAALLPKLREEDPAGEIQLKSARDFDPKRLSDAPKVYVVGDFPEIVEAYGDRVQSVVQTEAAQPAPADEVAEVTGMTSKKRK